MLNATMALVSHERKAPRVASSHVIDPCFKLLDKILDEGETVPVYQVLAISSRPCDEQDNNHQQFAYCIPVWSDKN